LKALRELGRLKVIVAIEPDISTETALVMVGANVQADRDPCVSPGRPIIADQFTTVEPTRPLLATVAI